MANKLYGASSRCVLAVFFFVFFLFLSMHGGEYNMIEFSFYFNKKKKNFLGIFMT